MSESDDTDILLLIPPDFFNTGCSSCTSSDYLQSVDSSYNNFNWGFSQNCCNMERPLHYNNNLPFEGNFQTHSTPIKPPAPDPSNRPQIVKESKFLNEIDTFLQTDEINYQRFKRKSPENSIIDLNNISMNDFQSINASDFNALGKFKKPRPVSVKSNLMSLNEIWGGSNSSSSDQTLYSLQEEKYRRQHLERNIQSLQSLLLEYEQKISVAINVDQEKNNLIKKIEQENLGLRQNIHDVELKYASDHEKFLAENADLKNKNLFFEKELADTITIVKKLQEKNEILENKVDILSTANNDVNEIHKRQLKDLEIRLSNSLEVEKVLNQKMDKLQADFVTEKENSTEYIRKQTESMNQKQKDLIYQNEELKRQVKELRVDLQTGNDEKRNLLKELDVQRLSLKKYYQSQVEDVVADKLKEFQSQLNNVEEQLKDEANRREKLIAERAIRQMELIKQANEQEINLLDEKHKEEVSICRLQLTHSTKTVNELEAKLAAYQSKRADIAEKLHIVMETQWKKALEILTSPSSTICDDDDLNSKMNKFKIRNSDKDKMDGVKSVRNIAENEVFQTPSRPTLPQDVLHKYIELLLRKSPKDLDSLNEILSSCKEYQELPVSCSKTTTDTAKTPKPWK